MKIDKKMVKDERMGVREEERKKEIKGGGDELGCVCVCCMGHSVALLRPPAALLETLTLTHDESCCRGRGWVEKRERGRERKKGWMEVRGDKAPRIGQLHAPSPPSVL